MSLRCVTCAFTLAVSAIMPRYAAAQPPAAPVAAPSAEAVRKAEEFYKEGVRLYREKKWTESERAFESAWALNPTVDVAYNLGSAEFRQDKHREAAEHLSFALRAWPLMDAMSSQRPIAEQRLAEARTFVGALTVKVNVAQAEVLVDGTAVGKAPLRGEVFVVPGTHIVEAKLEGYGSAKEVVALEKGAARTIELVLAPGSGSGAKGNGSATPPAGGGTAAAVAPAEGSVGGGPSKGLIIAGIAASAVAVGAGVVFAIVSNGKAADANEHLAVLLQKGGTRPCLRPELASECMETDGSRKARDTFADLSVWSFVAGGVLGASTAIYALTSSKSEPVSTVRALPIVIVRGGGLMVVGQW